VSVYDEHGYWLDNGWIGYHSVVLFGRDDNVEAEAIHPVRQVNESSANCGSALR
jgi:hypothetical protein